ncbi:UPF0114 protein [Capsulimonas corticalis]|uniref:UPF0114 protein CCAX7_54870 n=1 Tax=Capsulimonas corticalis TaxID=2219043 RepID=A0A402D5U4_9BACT|nr:YqhA family protein [Capsulimonas corticalis]BDI33436.1 UPF0114 protein [Capsulimonas corticalis]
MNLLEARAHAGVQRLIFNVRLILVPMYVLLSLSVVAFLLMFVKTLWGLMRHFHNLDAELTMLNVLSQLDQVMVANLIVMIIQGSYSTFVEELKIPSGEKKPSWLSHMSAGLLKVKMSMSLMGVSAVGLLPVFLEPSKYSSHEVVVKVAVHIVLMVSTLVLWAVTREEVIHKPEGLLEGHTHE